MARGSRNSDSNRPTFEQRRGVRWALIGALNGVSLLLVSPCAAAAAVERWLSPRQDSFFLLFAQLLAGIPGVPGVFLRRAYYHMTLEYCSLRVIIGYGAYFSHRDARVEDHAYVGPYAVLGTVHLGRWALIGTRASLLSGGSLHEADEQGRWLPADFARAQRISVGDHAWVGEGAILMADVGTGAMIAAGAVVSTPVPEHVAVAGNPARFVRKLQPEPTES